MNKRSRFTLGKYILKGHKPVRERDLYQWAEWMEAADRRVDLTSITPTVAVSTAFLGIDHNFAGGRPLLFETMVFGGEFDQDMIRTSTWVEAKAAHRKTVKELKEHYVKIQRLPKEE